MDEPKIMIDGKIYTPGEPKMKVWRHFLSFMEKDKSDVTMEEFLDGNINLIVLAFDCPEVTANSIDENLAISDVVPLTRELFRWLQAKTFSKLAMLPKVGTGKD